MSRVMLEQPNIEGEIEQASMLFDQIANDSRNGRLFNVDEDFIHRFNVILYQLRLHIKLSYVGRRPSHLGLEPHFIETK